MTRTATRPRMAITLLAAVAIALIGVTTAEPAYADRCEPEELVLGPGTSPIDERDHPLCYVLINYVYPQVCDDYTTLATCLGSFNPQPSVPNYTPYNPDPYRIYCNAFEFAFGSGTCAV